MNENLKKVHAGIDLYISEKFREDAKGIANLADEAQLTELARFIDLEDDTFFIIRLDFIKDTLVTHGRIGYETFPTFGVYL